MSNYSNGRRAEYRTMRFYEKQGYECVRAAGSHGAFDVIAIGRHDIKLIQVKKDCKPDAAEIETMKLFECPSICQKLTVTWKFRQALPIVKEI